MAEKITAILVDDEERARDVLANLLARFCPSIALLGTYANVRAAVEGVKKHQPQVVFLDIEMPNYAGHEILGFFEEIDFEIVFVTAYDSYAIKAFEVAAVDYLLKPVDIQRLQAAVEKVQEKIASHTAYRHYQVLRESLAADRIKNLVISEKGYQVVVPVEEIIAIEAQESYSKVYTLKKTYVASKNLKHFEGLLVHNTNFFRTHKSWIINLRELIKYNKTSGDIQLPNGIEAKLSKYRKEAFEREIA